jgi:TolB-like protein
VTTETPTFAERFRLTLEYLNYSRGRCAQELGVDKSLVGRWASGAVVPREHNLTRWTEIVRRAQPAFSLGDWRLDADAFAARLRGASVPAETPAVAPVSALASRPTLAVLPFAGLSERRTDAWLSDGIAEDIVTDLVRGRSLLPVVLGPSVASRGPGSDIKSVGRALGARYVLTGSVRLNPDDVRVSLQLTDAEAGMLVWAERFEWAAPDVRRQLNSIVATSVRSVAAAVAVAE